MWFTLALGKRLSLSSKRSCMNSFFRFFSNLAMYMYMYNTVIILVEVVIRFRVQFVINLHEWVFQKAEIAWATSMSAISAVWKTHKCKLHVIPNWTRKTVWLLINNINMKSSCGGSAGRSFRLEAIFSHSRNLFSKFPHKIFIIILHDIIIHWLTFEIVYKWTMGERYPTSGSCRNKACTGIAQAIAPNPVQAWVNISQPLFSQLPKLCPFLWGNFNQMRPVDPSQIPCPLYFI